MLIITIALMIIITDFPFVYKIPHVTDPGKEFFYDSKPIKKLYFFHSNLEAFTTNRIFHQLYNDLFKYYI